MGPRGLTLSACGSTSNLTNVGQEVNGLMTFDRKPKFDPAVIRAINQQKAAIER